MDGRRHLVPPLPATFRPVLAGLCTTICKSMWQPMAPSEDNTAAAIGESIIEPMRKRRPSFSWDDILIKDDNHRLGLDDLCTTNSEISNHTAVRMSDVQGYGDQSGCNASVRIER